MLGHGVTKRAGELLGQLLLLDLARLQERQLRLGAHPEVLRHLVRREVALQPGAELVAVEVASPRGTTAPTTSWPPPVGGDAGDVRLEHVGVRHERGLDLGRRDVGAAGRLDHLAEATGEVEPAVVVEVAGVAGAVPPVGLEHVFALASVQSLHERVAARPELAVDAGRHLLERCRGRRPCARCPGSVLPNVPRRDSGSGSYWSHESVHAAHLGHAQRRRVHLGRSALGRHEVGHARAHDGRDTLAAVYDGCSRIVLPCCGQPVTIVARSCSMRSSAAPASNELWVTSVAPTCSTWKQRGDQAADPEERHRREHHVVGRHRVARPARCTSGARPCPASGSRPSDRRCCPSCRRSPPGRPVRRTPRRARGTRRRCRRASPAATIVGLVARDQERSDGPHTWMARRNGASGRNNGWSARWPASPGSAASRRSR